MLYTTLLYIVQCMYMYTAQVQGAQVVGIVWAVSFTQVHYSWFAWIDTCGCVLVLYTSCTAVQC